MEKQMFCFQCQETSKGTGCNTVGVCGKQASTAALMDRLIFLCRGISVLSTALRNHQQEVGKAVDDFIIDALFSTITNANFDETALAQKVERGSELREQLKKRAEMSDIHVPSLPEVEWMLTDDSRDWASVGVLRHKDEDQCSLKELVTYGLKGIAAYMSHAQNLGHDAPGVSAFLQRALSDLTMEGKSIEELFDLVLETGQYGIKAMTLLDEANTSSYGHPQITAVSRSVGHRPGILVSGHDLQDLEQLLEQSCNCGIDVYTHGEMLPAHYYPKLKKFSHLKGNYGGSWWHQRDEFESFNGPILMTTNCIVPPLVNASYVNRLFTTGSAGYPGATHIEADEKGRKDFDELIRMAKKSLPPTPINDGVITGGFAHKQMELLTDKILDAVKTGRIRKFVVMAGCDGRMSARKYYTEFAQKLPHDCVILTAGCAKYRYNGLDLGTIDGIPRVLDAGQCNDSFSLVLTALHLRDKLGLKNVNELPIVYNIAWYEQKAVIVLLALLALGVKNIHIGPTFPAFLSPNVRKELTDRFGLDGIGNVEDDLKKMIG